MEKTQEELQRIKDAVLAEIKALLGESSSCLLTPRLRLRWSGNERHWECSPFEAFIDSPSVFVVYDGLPADDPYWGIAYSVLGLEARAERERAAQLIDFIGHTAFMHKLFIEGNPNDQGSRFQLAESMGKLKRAANAYEKGASHG